MHQFADLVSVNQQRCEALPAHVTAADRPFVVVFQQHRTDQSLDRFVAGGLLPFESAFTKLVTSQTQTGSALEHAIAVETMVQRTTAATDSGRPYDLAAPSLRNASLFRQRLCFGVVFP